MVDLNEYISRKLQDPEIKRVYDSLSLASVIAKEIVLLRNRRNLTQRELAELVGTQQSAISRLETGMSLPSLSFLEKVAAALGTNISIKLTPREDLHDETNYPQ